MQREHQPDDLVHEFCLQNIRIELLYKIYKAYCDML